MNISTRVLLSKKVTEDLDLLPGHIIKKFMGWVSSVELIGLQETRLNRGYHDEPLKGKRNGQRSIRLSRSYRVIYIEITDYNFEIIQVLEVNKHEY
jgi:proteic killer suppression protein